MPKKYKRKITGLQKDSSKRQDDLSAEWNDFIENFNTDPLIILKNLKPQLESMQNDPDTEDYIQGVLEDLITDIDISVKSHEKGDSNFFAWKMFHIGVKVSGLNLQELYQAGVTAVKGRNKKAEAQRKRMQLIEDRDDLQVADDPKIGVAKSMIKMKSFIRTYDREHNLSFAESNYERAIRDTISDHRNGKSRSKKINRS